MDGRAARLRRRRFLAGVAGSSMVLAGCSSGDNPGRKDTENGGSDNQQRHQTSTLLGEDFHLSLATAGSVLGGDEALDNVAILEATLKERQDDALVNPTFNLRITDGSLQRLIAGDFSVDPTQTDSAATGFGTAWEPGTTKSALVTFAPSESSACTLEAEVSGDAGNVASETLTHDVSVRPPGAPVSRAHLASAADQRAAVLAEYANTFDDTPGVGYDEQLRQALRGVTLSGGVLVGDALIGAGAGALGTAADAIWEGLSQHVSPFEALIDFEPIGPGQGVERERVESEAYAPPFFSALLDQGQGMLERFERQLKTGGDIERAAQKTSVLATIAASEARAEATAWRQGNDESAKDHLRAQRAFLVGEGITDFEAHEYVDPGLERVDASRNELSLGEFDFSDYLRQALGPLTTSSIASRHFPDTVQTAYTLREFAGGEGSRITHLLDALDNGLLERKQSDRESDGESTPPGDAGSAWPMYQRTPANTGSIAATGPVDLTTAWEFEAGDGFTSSPSVVDGTVYVGCNDNRVYAIDAEEGTEEWHHETGWVVFASPAVVNGTVYVGGRDGKLYAIDAAEGTVEWTRDLGAMSSSPVVVNGIVYVATWLAEVYALDAETGETQWQASTGNQVRSSPAYADGSLYLGAHDGNVYAFDAATGDETWRFQTGSEVHGGPVVHENTVFAGGGRGSFYAIDAYGGTKIWEQSVTGVLSGAAVAGDTVFGGTGYLHAFDIENGSRQWRSANAASAPTVTENAVYVGGRNRFLSVLDRSDGSELTNIDVGTVIYSSPTVVGNRVYFGDFDGTFYALESAN
jgi:outer membrane protein assembly factor BamB